MHREFLPTSMSFCHFHNDIKEQAVNPWLKNRPSSQKAAWSGKSNTLSLSENFFENNNCNVDLSKPTEEY